MNKTYSEPFINALSVEFMGARKHSEHLSSFEVAHTDDARSLIALMSFGVELIAHQLLNFEFSQSSGLGFA